MGKVSACILLCLSVLMMFGLSSAETFLSVPSDVAEKGNATIVIENSDVENFDVSLNVSGTEATYSDIFPASGGTASETIDLSSENLTQGKYSVSASVFNESIDFSDSSISGFKVLSGITGARMVDLTSKDISETECPLDKSKSMNDECKLFGVNVTVDGSSNLSELSESGEPLTASLNGGQNYVGLVDTESQGEYDTVFWDDDPVFRESNETGIIERSFVSPGEPVMSFRIGNRTAQLNTMISGENLVFSVSPTSDEVPFRQSDSITYAFLGYSEADQVLGSAVDVTPVEGVEMRAVSRNLGDQNTKTLQTPNSTTNKYGFTGIGNIQSANVGRHKVSINNVSSEYYEVKSFSVNYRILDPSTGTRDKVFRPGEAVKVEAVPTLNGEKLSYDSIQIELTDSSGQRFNKTLDQSNSAIFNISEDASGGRASVSIKVESGGVTQTESTSFEIKKFKVHTIPLRYTDKTARSADSFAPGSTGYVLVNAVQLGTFGGVNDITDAKFYDIDNSSTEKDECKQNVGGIRGQLNGGDALDTVNKTNLNDSSIFSERVKTNLPEGLKTQCVVKFDVKKNISGFFSGEIPVERLETNETQKGSISFGISRFRMRGSSVDPVTTEFEYEFGSSERVGIEPRVRRIGDYSTVDDSRILDASVLDIEGESDATVRNATFNASGNSLLSFESPDSSGDYRARFTATVNTTDSPSETRTVTGTAYFDVEVFEVEEEIVQPDTSYRVPPQSNVSVEVKVTEPGSDKGIEGLEVNLTELENGQQETNYLDDITVDVESTDENGTATLRLLPKDGWEDGYYTGDILVTGPSGSSEDGFLYFRVDKYNVRVQQSVNGESYDRFRSRGVLSGDTVQLDPAVYENNGLRGYRGNGGETVAHDIDISDSSLIYYGNGVRYSSEEIPLINKTSTTEEDGGEALNLSTDELSPGSYRIELGLDLNNGDSVTEDSYFDVDAFEVNVTQKSNQESFQPGSKVTYFVNTSKTSDYKIEADDVRSYNYRTGERSEFEPNLGQKFQDASSMAVNISIPESASEGSYNGDLEISSEGTTQYETITFDVDTKGVGIPKTAELQYSTDNSLEPQIKIFSEDETTHFTETDCSGVLNREDLDFESHDQSGKNCSVASSRFSEFNVTWIDQAETQSWNDSKVYITEDSTFNESGDITRNKSLYEPVSLPRGLEMNITEISPYNLEMTPLNGFSSRVIVDRSADSYFYDEFSSTVDESDFGIETDINGDGDKEDTVRALLVNNSGQFTTRISFNNNFTSGNSTLVDTSGADLGGEVAYPGELRNSSGGVKRNLIFATSSENGDIDAELSEGSNITIPVIASYPNGTPVSNQQVGVSKFIRQSSAVTESKIFKTSRASAVTDSNGMAFINTDLPDLGTRATATYDVIVTTLGDERNPIDTFDAPEVTVSKFSKSSNTYSRVSVGEMSSYSDQDKTTNSENLELNEGINLADGRFSTYESTEYRYKNVTEKIGSNCYDFNRNYQCDDSLQILLYDNGFSNVEGLDVNEGIIDDDPILGQGFRQETRAFERSVRENQIFANYSSVQLSRSISFIDTFMVFNESVDSLSMFNTDVYTDDNVYLALRGTELFSQKPVSGTATVEELSYDGETFNPSSTISKPIDDEGFVIFSLSREDFSGSEESWEEGPIAFEGTINGTSYIKRVSIQDSDERDKRGYRESLDSEPPSTSDNWTKQGLTDVGPTDVELNASDNQSEVSKVAYKKDPGNFYNVTVKNGYYYLNGTKQEKIDLERGVNYTFNLASSVEGHPFHISTSSVGGNFNDIVTEGVSVTDPYDGNPHAAQTGKLYYKPAENAKSTLYYQCGLHNNMGAELSILDRANYQVVNGNLASITISSPGNNTLQYFAMDKFGNREDVQKEFVDILENSAPSVSIEKNVTDPVTGETIQFDASGSTDSDGSIEEYSWDLDDDGAYGDAEGTAKAIKKFSTDGEKRVSVKVTDNNGLTSEKTLSFSVVSDVNNVDITINNDGSSAWEVTSVSGNESEVASIGTNNPDIRLQKNTRYTITNNGHSAHPLRIKNSTGKALLSQQSGENGKYESNSMVDWVDNGGTLEFTVTQNLYNELDGYVCTVHPTMEGDINP